MPQFLIDWNNWWVAFWSDHPVIFWVAVIAAVVFTILSHRLRSRQT
jgi:hypothetical protein